jgi:hypothetical protein
MKKLIPLTAVALVAAACADSYNSGPNHDYNHAYRTAPTVTGTTMVKPDGTYYRDSRGVYYYDTNGAVVYTTPGTVVYPGQPVAGTTVVTPGYAVESHVDEHHKYEDPLSERSMGSNRGTNNSVMPNQDRVEYNYVPTYTVRRAYVY